jgi:thymidylate kinase
LLKESDGAQNTLLELFIRDRDWHWRNQVSEMGYDGTWVVSDRWHYSTMVYQSLTTEQSVFAIESQLRTVAPHADLTVVLDMETTVAESRMAARERDAFEKDTSLQFKVRWKYRELAKERDDLVVVSGVGCADEVHQRVLGAVSARFPGA